MIKVQHHLDRFQNAVTSGFYYALRIILSLGFGFLTAKCVLFENFSPFSLILLSISMDIGLIPTFCYIGSSLGILSGAFSLSVFKYMTALTMIYVVYMVFRKSLHVVKNDTAVLSAVCCFTAGFLFLLVDQLSLYNFLILTGESILICCCIYFVTYAIRAFRNCCYLSSRELIAAAITMILILVTLHNVFIFGMSVSRMVGMSLLFMAFCCLKTSHAAVLGCCLGIIMSAAGGGGEAIFTAMIVGTLVGCVFSAFSDRFAMTAFTLVYYTILFFFGKFPWNYWYFAEPLVAYAIVFFIPKQRVRTFLSSYIAVKKSKKSNANHATNEQMILACKKECQAICPKAMICYEKNVPELSEALDSLSERFYQTEELGNVEVSLPFCIKPNAMSEIIEKSLISRHFEDFEELIDQLDHLSRKIERKMDASVRTVRFLTDEEKTMKAGLEKRRLTVRDINFIIDEFNCKKCDIQFQLNGDILYEKIIREVAEPYFKEGLVLKTSKFEDGYLAHIRESRPFELACAALCRTKNGEQMSGDTALGFSAGEGLYYLILADGMGSGKDAGVQSELVIDTIRRLVAGGLSVPSALNVYRSASRFRQENYFTTVDVCAIDLNDGIADFYKAGAYDSFHLHEDRLITLRGGGMPLGLGEKDRLRHVNIKLQDGDYLILASDGLSALNDQLEDVLVQCRDTDVRKYARKILQGVSEKCDSAVCDDVTVMVCKFHKKVE